METIYNGLENLEKMEILGVINFIGFVAIIGLIGLAIFFTIEYGLGTWNKRK